MLTLSVETATDWTSTYCSCFWQPSCPESEANQHCVGTITFFFVLEIHIVTPKLPLWLKQGTNYWSAFMPRFCKVATSYPSPLRELTNHLPGCGDENFDLTNLWIEWRLTATWGDGSPLCLFCLDGDLFSLSYHPASFLRGSSLPLSIWLHLHGNQSLSRSGIRLGRGEKSNLSPFGSCHQKTYDEPNKWTTTNTSCYS